MPPWMRPGGQRSIPSRLAGVTRSAMLQSSQRDLGTSPDRSTHPPVSSPPGPGSRSIRGVYLRSNRLVRRNDFASFDETVLLLNGFFQTRTVWEIMEDRLQSDGYGVLSFDLGGVLWRYQVRSITEQASMIRQDRGNLRTHRTRALPHRGPLDGRITRPSVHPAQRGRPPSEITHDPGNPPSRYADGPCGTRSDRARDSSRTAPPRCCPARAS